MVCLEHGFFSPFYLIKRSTTFPSHEVESGDFLLIEEIELSPINIVSTIST